VVAAAAAAEREESVPTHQTTKVVATAEMLEWSCRTEEEGNGALNRIAVAVDPAAVIIEGTTEDQIIDAAAVRLAFSIILVHAL